MRYEYRYIRGLDDLHQGERLVVLSLPYHMLTPEFLQVLAAERTVPFRSRILRRKAGQ
jgi:hypothetical protein